MIIIVRKESKQMTMLVVIFLLILLGIVINQRKGIGVVIDVSNETLLLKVFDDKILLGSDGSAVLELSQGEKIKCWTVAKRSSLEDDSLILILGDQDGLYGDRVVIYNFKNDGLLERKYGKSMKGMNPWELKIADIDGDQVKELCITMFKETKFHPVMANRPYIYKWNEDTITPFWRGSRLARPFSDYGYHDLDGDGKAEIVAIEYNEVGEQQLHAYFWKGFGFESLAESISFSNGRDFIITEGIPLQGIVNEKRTYIYYNRMSEKIEFKE